MKTALAEIFDAHSTDGRPDTRLNTAFGLLLLSAVTLIAGVVFRVISGDGTAQRVFALIATLALLSSLYLTAELKGGRRAVFLTGAAATALALSEGIAVMMTGGGPVPDLDLAAGGALLVAIVPLLGSAARAKPAVAGNEHRTTNAE